MYLSQLAAHLVDFVLHLYMTLYMYTKKDVHYIGIAQ